MDPTLDPDFVPPSERKNSRSRPYYNDQLISCVDGDELQRSGSSSADSSSSSSNSCSTTPGDGTTRIEEPITTTQQQQNGFNDRLVVGVGPPSLVAPISPGSENPPPTTTVTPKPLHSSSKPKITRRSSHAWKVPSDPFASLRDPFHSADLEEVPKGIKRQASTLDTYVFPTHRLVKTMQDETRDPLVIVSCGSFSPITYLHLRMFEMAMDTIEEDTNFEVIGGYYSPVSDRYKKPGLAPAHHRVRMCELACERTSTWLMVDAWESLQPTYQRTAVVLDHFFQQINVVHQGVQTPSGTRRHVHIMLLAGGDLIQSMGEPNVWADSDLHHILGRYGCLIVERTGGDVRSFLLSHDIMYEHRKHIIVIKQLIYNDISSTKVRLFIRRGMSVQYLLPNSVIRYILEKGLYKESEPVSTVLEVK